MSGLQTFISAKGKVNALCCVLSPREAHKEKSCEKVSQSHGDVFLLLYLAYLKHLRYRHKLVQ